VDARRSVDAGAAGEDREQDALGFLRVGLLGLAALFADE
jgi:hypothetical protein